MVGIGPRVGGAHVDVNLSFNDRSVGQIGRQIHRQLSSVSRSVSTVGKRIQKQLGDLARNIAEIGDRNREIYQSIGRDGVVAWRSLLGVVVSGSPLIGSALSAVAGAAVSVAGAFYSATQNAYAFAPVLASVGVAAGTAFLGLRSFFQALKSGDLSGLTPSAKAAAKAVQGLGDAWQAVKDEIQERIFKDLADDIAKLSETLLPVLQSGLGKMADSLNLLAQDMLDYVNSADGLKVINKFLDNMADIFARLSQAIVPALDGILRLLNALSPAARRLADRIADVARNFQDWTKAEGFGKRINFMMLRAEKTTGLLLKVLGNLGSALTNVFNAANPATNMFLDMLVDLTQRFEDWTGSVEGKNSIARWAESSVDVMRQFGHTLEAVFKVVAELADPRVIISFLKTVEGAFEYLAQLPLDRMVDAFVQFAEALQPVSSLFLAITIAGVSFNMALGVMIGQLAGVFSWIGRLITPLSGLFKPLASAGAHGKELTGLAAAFGRLSGAVSVLVRGLKFIPFVGWAIWVVMLVAKSEKLRDELDKLWDKIKDFGQSFVDAFNDIKESLEPLEPVARGVGKALGKLFDIMDTWGGIVVGNAFRMLGHTFSGLGSIIRGLGKIVAGVIDVFVGLFSLDPGKMLDGFKKMVSGLMKIFGGLAEILFAPLLTGVETLGTDIINGLMGGLDGIVEAMFEFGKKIIDSAKTVLGINSPSTVFMSIGMDIINGLVSGIQAVFSKVVSIISRMVGAMIQATSRLPGRLFQLGREAVTRMAGAVSAGVKRLKSLAGDIFSGIVNAVSKLPSRLSSLGSQAVSKMSGAFRSGVGAMRGIARKILDEVVDIIERLPGKLTGLASDFLTAGKTLGGKILEGMEKGIRALGDLAGSVAGDLKRGINAAIGLPKSMSFKVFKKTIGFTIPGFRTGTQFAPGGFAKVGEDGPELIDLPRGSKVYTNSQTKRMLNNGGGMPSTMVLRIGARDFIAYVEELADNRIDAADNLAWQGV